MNPASKQLISSFFSGFPRLDFLFKNFFAQQRISLQQKPIIYKEAVEFIRLFPVYAFSKGMDPFASSINDDLIAPALLQFHPDSYIKELLHADFIERSGTDLYKRFGLPEFFTAHMLSYYDKNFILNFLKRSISERPLFLRKTGNAGYQHKNIIPFKGIPKAFLLTDKILDFRSRWYTGGYFLVQDISSQLAGLLVNPKPNQKILDACAGNGGKTITLSDLMKGRGEITAIHFNRHNRMELKKRLRLHNIQNVRQVLIENDRPPDFTILFDIVWIDAPCSGTGVIRRNPDIIYRLVKTDFIRLQANQLSLLETYSRFVKPGGQLVYSTCSVIKEENEDVIKQFLASSKVQFAPFPFTEGKNYYSLLFPDDYMQTWGGGDYFDSDGFFTCSLKRIG
jgi:16S rRNA C967 or C1407 C5-methylase (RsmB/RsmF family)